MASQVKPTVNTLVITSATVVDTSGTRTSVGASQCAIDTTCCWMLSERVPRTMFTSTPSHSTTYTRPSSTDRRVRRLIATKTAEYAIAPTAAATASASPTAADSASSPATNSGGAATAAVTPAATASLVSRISYRGSGFARTCSSVPSS